MEPCVRRGVALVSNTAHRALHLCYATTEGLSLAQDALSQRLCSGSCSSFQLCCRVGPRATGGVGSCGPSFLPL